MKEFLEESGLENVEVTFVNLEGKKQGVYSAHVRILTHTLELNCQLNRQCGGSADWEEWNSQVAIPICFSPQ